MHEKELMTIKDALFKWHQYVDNDLFIIVITDYNSLKYMNIIQKSSKKLAWWINEFQQYNLIIKYRFKSQAIMLNVINRWFDFNVLLFKHIKNYIFYIRQFLQDHLFFKNANELNKTQIVAKVNKFDKDAMIILKWRINHL